MNKYNNGKIYTIRSTTTDKYYIGSTVQPLYKRFHDHKDKYNKYLKTKKGGYNRSYEIFKLGDAYIELLENSPCKNKDELTRREGELIRQYKNNLVNHNIPSGIDTKNKKIGRAHV